MSTTRLWVLGLLAERGPMHGHQLRRQAELINLEDWGDVKVGALYGALHRMEAEGLIVEVRSEQAGRFPARTVYAITDEGCTELTLLQQRALQEARLPSDPFDVALVVADLTVAEFEQLTAQRRRALTTQLEQLVAERERLQAAGYLRQWAYASFRHGELRVQAELAFLDELATLLPRIVAEKQELRTQETPNTTQPSDVVPLDPSRRSAARRRAPDR